MDVPLSSGQIAIDVTVYCYNMNTATPTQWLVLPNGGTTNYNVVAKTTDCGSHPKLPESCTVEDSQIVLNVIDGGDDLDSTSWGPRSTSTTAIENENQNENENEIDDMDLLGVRVGIPLECQKLFYLIFYCFQLYFCFLFFDFSKQQAFATDTMLVESTAQLAMEDESSQSQSSLMNGTTTGSGPYMWNNMYSQRKRATKNRIKALTPPKPKPVLGVQWPLTGGLDKKTGLPKRSTLSTNQKIWGHSTIIKWSNCN